MRCGATVRLRHLARRRAFRVQILPRGGGQAVGITLAIAVCQSSSGEARFITQRTFKDFLHTKPLNSITPSAIDSPFPVKNWGVFVQVTLTKGGVFQTVWDFLGIERILFRRLAEETRPIEERCVPGRCIINFSQSQIDPTEPPTIPWLPKTKPEKFGIF